MPLRETWVADAGAGAGIVGVMVLHDGEHGFGAVRCTDRAGNEEREPDVRYEWRP